MKHSWNLNKTLNVIKSLNCQFATFHLEMAKKLLEFQSNV